MACRYCSEGAALKCEGIVSEIDDERTVDVWIESDHPSLMVRAWIDDDNSVDAEYPIAFCPVCGRNMRSAGR